MDTGILRTVQACLAAAALAAGPLAAGEAPAAGRLEGEKVLDTLSYWRSFYTLKPAAMSLKLWAKEGKDAKSLSSAQRFLRYPFNGHWDISEITALADSPPPPEGWEQPDFNDGTWARMRWPMLMGGGGVSEFAVGSACFRARFFVDDPGRVGKLRLRAAYRGGLVAWVNGREVGRGHLPAGAVTAETVATEYTEDEYSLPPRDDLDAKLDPKGQYKGQRRCIQEIGDTYEQTMDRMTSNYYFAAPITSGEYEDLKKRRNRVLGPIEIDPRLLQKGVNVLALQVVRSDLHPAVTMGKPRLGPAAHYGWAAMAGGMMWSHGAVLDVQLRSGTPGAVQPEQRPAGVQLWADDPNRRVFSPEFGDPGKAARTLRMVGARQGSYSAQLVIGTDRELRGLAGKAGDLVGPGGAKIPASAISVRWGAGRPVRDLCGLGVDRNPQEALKHPLSCSDTWTALWRFSPRGNDGSPLLQVPAAAPSWYGYKQPDPAVDAAMKEIQYFDELAPEPPAAVPANSCQPAWLTVKIPADAAPGLYAGTLQVSAAGTSAEEAPVKVQVVDWKLPDPARGEDFTTMIAMEQSPWGVARACQVAPWSDEHFRQMEKSLRRMGELGNDYLIIPVLLDSEFGNRGDSFVIWVKGRDGRLACDFSRLDRYLDIALKHMPRPAAVCFGVTHPPENNLWVVPRVLMRDEAGGKVEPGTVPMGEANPFKGPKPEFSDQDRAAAREFWKPFVEGVLARMEKRGLKSSVFWGYAWDYTLSVERYRGVFEELAPGVKWARGSHGHGGISGGQGMSGPFGFVGTIVCLPQPVKKTGDKLEICSHKGWKGSLLHLALPRIQDAVLCVEGRSVPYLWRLFPELALCGGARGICRIGADYWEGTCQDGWRGGGQVGIGITAAFWPGKDEANSGARFEMLREGLQEAEARVAVEKALEGALGGTPEGKRIQKALDDRIIGTLHIMRSYYNQRPSEQDFGWQERSWDLYAAAAAAAGGRALSAGDKAGFFGTGR